MGDYVKLLKALLPRGRAWSRESGDLTKLLTGTSRELVRADTVVGSLLSERDTRTADALLPEHEEDLGLAAGSLTKAQRRAAAHAQRTAMGGQDPAYFVRVAAALGYTITIEESRPAWCGIAVVGDPCGDQDALFTWLVRVQYSASYPDPTGADLLALLEKLKPAHTQIVLLMASPGFSRGFRKGFDALPALTPAQLAVGGFRWRGFSKGFNLKYGGGFKYGSFSRGFNNLK